MSWKSLIPYHGDYTVRKKLRELDKAGIGVPMVIILFLQKGLETSLKQFSNEIPLPLSVTYIGAGLLVFLAWLYDKQIRDAAKEKAEDL